MVNKTNLIRHERDVDAFFLRAAGDVNRGIGIGGQLSTEGTPSCLNQSGTNTFKFSNVFEFTNIFEFKNIFEFTNIFEYSSIFEFPNIFVLNIHSDIPLYKFQYILLFV